MKRNQKHSTSRKVIPYRAPRNIPYPNAASARDVLDRILDLMLTAAASAGIITILMFLFIFF